MCEKDVNEIVQKLKEPFERKDIEFRVAKVSKRTRKVLVLAYINSRAVMQKLDTVFGVDGWKDEYEVLKGGVTCKLSVKISGEFITKQDAAPFSNIEALKGAFSAALKRAAVKFGVGRYLYQLPEYFVELMDKKPANAGNKIHHYYSKEISGWWIEPDLPDWAVNGGNGKIEDKEKGKTEKREDGKSGSDKSVVAPSNDLRSLLQKKIDYLLKKNIINVKKHTDYRLKITDDETGKGLLNYFLKQFELLYRMYKLLELNKISDDQQKKLYQRIMSSKSTGLSLIDKDLHQMEDIS